MAADQSSAFSLRQMPSLLCFSGAGEPLPLSQLQRYVHPAAGGGMKSSAVHKPGVSRALMAAVIAGILYQLLQDGFLYLQGR